MIFASFSASRFGFISFCVVATGRDWYTSLQFCRVVSSSVTFKPPKHHEIPNPEALGIDGAETCAETSGNWHHRPFACRHLQNSKTVPIVPQKDDFCSIFYFERIYLENIWEIWIILYYWELHVGGLVHCISVSRALLFKKTCFRFYLDIYSICFFVYTDIFELLYHWGDSDPGLCGHQRQVVYTPWLAQSCWQPLSRWKSILCQWNLAMGSVFLMMAKP